MAKKKTAAAPVSEVEKWLGHIASYDRFASQWESRTVKIIQRYTDYTATGARSTGATKFNILWSNVQTLQAATFAKLPKPDVSRRFRDSDPIGRIGSLILERDLEYEIQHYSDYDFALRACILDRFLGGRGTAWIRYEPHFRAAEMQLPPDGLQVTEDAEEPQEELDYECAPVDYVHWKDFGHTVARTWDEVTGVWRKVYMTRDAMVRRFGEKIGNKIPLDAIPEEFKEKNNTGGGNRDMFRGLIYEIWDKESKQAKWLSKSLGEFCDERDDPLGLEEFFPCPKPLYSTLTNESLIPTPDFTLYQDQARELDTLSDRIDGLVKALQVKGCYDASIPALGRLFTEGENTNLIPVKNWAAFAEKQGLKGAIEIVELKTIYEALQACYMAMEQIKNQVYEITGISDIVRGQSQSDATATAERIKGQFASLRLKAYQDEVARFAAEIIQLKAQVICNKFAPASILEMAAAKQLNVTDSDVVAAQPQLGVSPQPAAPMAPGQPPAPPAPPPVAMMPPEAKQQVVFQAALQLLIGERLQNPDADTPNPMRSFRIEIESDSLVHLDDEENKRSRLEFLTVMGKFMAESVGLLATSGPMAPSLVTPLMEMWKFSAQAFKVGKNIEGSIDEATEQLKKKLMEVAQSPQGIPPEVQKQLQEAQKQLQEGARQVATEKEGVEKGKLKLFEDRTKLDVDRIGFEADKQVFNIERKAVDESIKNKEAVKSAEDKASGEVVKLKEVSAQREQEMAGQVGEIAGKAATDVSGALTNIQQTLEEIQSMQARLMAVEKAQNALIQREVVGMERVNGPDGRLRGIRKKLANGEMQEVAVN